MHRRPPRSLSFFLGLALALGAARAGAQGKPQEVPKIGDIDRDLEAGEVRPPAPDQRTGHLVFGASGGAVGPAGEMAPNTASSSLGAVGYTVGGFLGVGVGRNATLQAIGDYTHFTSPGICGVGCGGRAYTIGLGMTYHLVQGIAFDPWASFGVAYRNSVFTVLNPVQSGGGGEKVLQSYQGIDIARVQLGGDFYPLPWLGFGPFLEMDLGTNFRWPPPCATATCTSQMAPALSPDVPNTPRAYAFFQIGFRIAFDPMRKASRPPPPATVGAARASSPEGI